MITSSALTATPSAVFPCCTTTNKKTDQPVLQILNGFFFFHDNATRLKILTLSWIVKSSPALRSISTTSILASSAARCIGVWDLLMWWKGEKKTGSFPNSFFTYKLRQTFYWPTLSERSYIICGVDVAAGRQQQMDDGDVAVFHCQVERSLLALRAKKKKSSQQILVHSHNLVQLREMILKMSPHGWQGGATNR